MTLILEKAEPKDLLRAASAAGKAAGLPYAGTLRPKEAYALFSSGCAMLVDVRTAEEMKFVGHVPGSIHVPWATGPSLARYPRFLRELQARVEKDAVLLMICRSGKRSAAAAEVATRAGYRNVFNVEDGFEGQIDGCNQRGRLGGWRFEGLPWIQD